MNKNDSIDIKSMECFFKPESIAIIGASQNLLKLNSKPLAALLKKNYSGDIYPINPRYTEIEGIPCYPSILDVSGDIDMVIAGLPSNLILDVINQCVQKNVKCVVVFSGGFAETGLEGQALQDKIAEIAIANNIKIIGPNCFGFVYMRNAVMATFLSLVEDAIYPKSFGFVTQSGLLGILAYYVGSLQGIGLGCFASVGNELNTDFSDFTAYLIHDEETKIVGGYLERIKNVNKFRSMAEAALDKQKPLLLIKAGSSKDGKRAATHHTASDTGDDKVFDGFFKQMGIIRIDHINDLWPFIKIHSSGRIPKGRNVSIITGSGGTGIMMADRCEKVGLRVPEIKGKTLNQLEQALPFFASGRNPVDMTTAPVNDVNMMPNCLRAVVNDDNIDIVLICAFGNIENKAYMQKALDDLVDIYKSTDKPIVLCMDPNYIHPEIMETLKEAGVPVIGDEMQVINALASLLWYRKKLLQRNNPAGHEVVIRSCGEPKKPLVPQDNLNGCRYEQLLSDYKIPVANEESSAGLEASVKAVNDPVFGYVLKFSFSGILANALGDVSCRVAPINYEDSKEMVKEIKGYQALQKEYDMDAIADVIYKISRLVEDYEGEIKELTLSLVIDKNSATVKDADIITNELEEK